MGPDLADRLEAFVEAGGVWDAGLLAALLDELEASDADATARQLADALRPILVSPRPSPRAANDVEGLVYPRLWKIVEAIRDGLPDGEVRNRIDALRARLDAIFRRDAPPADGSGDGGGGGGGDGDRTWTLSAAAWLAVAEVVLLGAVVIARGSSAAPLTIAFLAIKLPFCLQVTQRRAGAYLGMYLWEVAGVLAAVRATDAAAGLRVTELVVAVTVIALLAASISLFPSVRLPEQAVDQ